MVEVPAQVAEGELLEAVFEGEAVVGWVRVEGPIDAGNAFGHDGGMGSLVPRKAGGSKLVIKGFRNRYVLFHPGIIVPQAMELLLLALHGGRLADPAVMVHPCRGLQNPEFALGLNTKALGIAP